MLEVSGLDFQAVGAAAAVAEVHLAQGLGRDLAEMVLGGSLLPSLEEAAGVVRGSARARWRSRGSSVLSGAAV